MVPTHMLGQKSRLFHDFRLPQSQHHFRPQTITLQAVSAIDVVAFQNIYEEIQCTGSFITFVQLQNFLNGLQLLGELIFQH